MKQKESQLLYAQYFKILLRIDEIERNFGKSNGFTVDDIRMLRYIRAGALRELEDVREA